MISLKKVESEEEINDVYRLRYQVYCHEKKFEEQSCFPDRQEIDEYDPYSIHFLAKKDSETIGTARLILNNPIGFPAEKHCNMSVSFDESKKQMAAEISRFAISKVAAKSAGCNRQKIVLGLIREMYHESRRLGIQYFYAAMGKGLHKLLLNCGIIFLQAGPEVDYRGKRAPYITWTKNLEDGLFMKDIKLFRYITSSDCMSASMDELAFSVK